MVKVPRVRVALRTDLRFLTTALWLGGAYAVVLIILQFTLGSRVAEIASVVLAGSAVFVFRKLDQRRTPSVVNQTTREPGVLVAATAGVLLIFSGTLPADVFENLLNAAVGDITRVRSTVHIFLDILFTIAHLGGFFVTSTILGRALPGRALFASLFGVLVYAIATVGRALTLSETAIQAMPRLPGDTGGRMPSVVGALMSVVFIAVIAAYGARLGSSSSRRG